MRIVCPSCAAAYEVPDARVVAGQAVRCARCGKNWTPVAAPGRVIDSPEDSRPSVAAEPPPVFEAVSVPDPPRVAPGLGPRALALDRLYAFASAGPAVLAGWILSIVVLAAFAWAAVAWRSDIMHAWPPSQRLYSALGWPADR